MPVRIGPLRPEVTQMDWIAFAITAIVVIAIIVLAILYGEGKWTDF